MVPPEMKVRRAVGHETDPTMPIVTDIHVIRERSEGSKTIKRGTKGNEDLPKTGLFKGPSSKKHEQEE
jgi:hypothetical protein